VAENINKANLEWPDSAKGSQKARNVKDKVIAVKIKLEISAK
jgi:hypothetical protein